jgi:PRTRC genetic system protein C
MEAQVLSRVFVFNGMQLPDPDANLSPAKVKDFYAGMYPELVTAEVSNGVEKGDSLEYTFIKATGTKGKKSIPKKEDDSIPFVQRLQAADKAQVGQKKEKATTQSLALTLYGAINQAGEPMVMPSQATPLFL